MAKETTAADEIPVSDGA